MSRLEHYRESYEYEKDCNQKMLAMIESVPDTARGDVRFAQAVTLAAHLAACRENWLNYMDGDGLRQAPWFDKTCDVAALSPRYAALEAAWTDYLARLTDAQLAADFQFPIDGGALYSLKTEIQVIQLIGHANYHRGQIALLVDQLGGETVDTDYADWATSQ